jgi:hypothetical protein
VLVLYRLEEVVEGGKLKGRDGVLGVGRREDDRRQVTA